jgi:hypothetical protein
MYEKSIDELNKIAKEYFARCMIDSFKESIKEMEFQLKLLKKETAMPCDKHKMPKPKAPKPKK